MQRLRPWVVTAAVVLLGGCRSASFEHGDASSVSDSSGGFVSEGGPSSFSSGQDGLEFTSSGELSFPNADGNYPDPAVTRCGDVLGDLPPIPGLASAWAVVAVPGAMFDGAPLETGSVRLRLSQQAISDCGGAPVPRGFSDESLDHGLELMLAPDESTLGLHEVVSLADPRVAVFGEGAATSDPGAGGSIELLRVDDDCMIGIARGFVTATGEPFMEGGFVAQTCQRQCVPGPDVGC